MQTQNTHGWSTLQEGNEHYLYRPISSLGFNNIEMMIQQLQDCQNPSIAIPEIVRTPNGEIYLKEPRGIRSFEDFLQTNPSTRAKLFVTQQLVKLLDNLHTFVGMSHGNLHLGCLSIDADNKLILGGISPANHDNPSTKDTEAFRLLMPKIFSESDEEPILDQLQSKSFKQIRGRVKTLLAEDTWDDIQSDWSTAVHNTSIEESSEDVLSSPISTIQTTNNQQPLTVEPEVFSATSATNDSDKGNSDWDDLNSLPEPEVLQQNVALTENDVVEEKEEKDEKELDDWESTLEDSDWDDDWDDLNLDTWLEDDQSIPESTIQPNPDAEPNQLSVEVNTSQSTDQTTSQTSTTETSTQTDNKSDNADDGDFDDWFTEASLQSEDALPTPETEDLSNANWDHTEWEATSQTNADLEELSDFDEDDDFELEVTEAIAVNPSAPFTLQSKSDMIDETDTQNPEIGSNDTLDFLLDQETNLHPSDLSGVDDFDHVDEFNQSHDEIPALDDDGDFATDIFSRSSLLGTLDIPASEVQDTLNDTPSKTPMHMQKIDEDDWFAPSSAPHQSVDTIKATQDQESNGLPKWAWVAGLVVVAGGAWASTRSSDIKDPNVLIDESQTKTTSTKELTPVPSVDVVDVTDVKKSNEPSNVETNLQENNFPDDLADANETVSTNNNRNKTKVVASATPKRASAPTKVVAKKTTKKVRIGEKPSPFSKQSSPALTNSDKATTTTAKPVTSVDSLPPPKKNVAQKKVATKSLETPKPASTVLTKNTDSKPAPQQASNTESSSTPVNKQVATPVTNEKAKPTNTTEPSPMEIAASLQAMVTGKTTTPEASTKPPLSQKPASEPEIQASIATEQTNPIAHSAVDSVAVQVQQTEQTPSPSVSESTSTIPTQEPAQEKDKEVSPNTQTDPPTPSELTKTTDDQPPSKSVQKSLNTQELNDWSKQAITGTLDTKRIADLQSISKEEPTFTRAQSIVLTHAQQSGSTELIGQSLQQILSIDANTHKPIYLLAMAQHQFNQQNLDSAREYLMQAERNWVNVEREQLMVLRAQRDNIVAHLSYVSFLETGSEDSRLQSVSHFRKVKREANRAKLRSLLEQAESKIQQLKGGNA